MYKIKEDANLQPVFIKSFKVDALCVPLARQPNATHKAVSIALLPPTFIKAKPNSKPKTTYAGKSNSHMLRDINRGTHFRSVQWWNWSDRQTQFRGYYGTWSFLIGFSRRFRLVDCMRHALVGWTPLDPPSRVFLRESKENQKRKVRTRKKQGTW